MNAIFNWFCANRLSLNASKTHYMVINPPHKNLDLSAHSLKIDNMILSKVSSCKFLGITLDESLSWRKQLSSINSKISKALFVIKQVKFSLPIESLHTLYFSLLHPHLTYGILAWGNAKNNLLKKTQTIQKRAMRTIYNKIYNSHTDPLFKESRILKISDLYQLEVMTFMHDIIHGKLPISFDNIYHMNYQMQGVYETRQAHMFHVPRTKSRFVDKLPLFQFPTIWNNWYSQMNVNSSRNAMRLRVKSIYLNCYFAAVKCKNTLCSDCHSIA